MKKISFIIPAYNCQNTIIECVNSILNCNYPNIEILIINDCSDDKTKEICLKSFNKNPKIKILNNIVNKGTSTTRNIGLNSISGDYIWFVDSDDTIISNITNEFISILETNPNMDIFCFNHNKVHQQKHTPTFEFPDCNNKIITGIEYLDKYQSLYLWDKIYSAKLIDDIRFVDGTKNIEDFYFNLQVIKNAKNIYTSRSIGYNYNCNNMNSTSRNRSKKNLIKLSQDTLIIQKLLLKDIKSSQSREIKNALLNKLNYSIAGHIFSLINFYNLNRLKKVLNIYMNLALYPINKTNNRRANLFIFIVNHKALLFIVAYFYQIKRYIQ